MAGGADIFVSFGADTAELEASLAVAKAQVSALASDFRDLTEQFQDAGANIDSDLGQQMVALGGKMNDAKGHVTALKEELKGVGKPEGGGEERLTMFERLKETMEATFSPLVELQSHFAEIAEVVAGAFAVEKVAEFVKGLGEAAEQTERLSRIFGISTEEVGKLQYAAAMTGTDMQDITMVMGRFEAALPQAEAGTGRVAAGLTALGLSAQELKGKSLDEQFRDIAEAVSKFADGPAKAAALQDLGRSFVQLIPLLDEGREGFDKLSAGAEQAGATLDEFSNARLVDMLHGIVNIGQTLGGLATDTIAPFINAINGAVQIITDLVQGLRDSEREGGLLSATLGGVAYALQHVEQFIAETILILKDLWAAGQTAALVLIEAFTGSGEAIAEVFRALSAGISRFFGALLTAGSEAAHAVAKEFTDLGTVIGDAMKGDFGGAKAAFAQMGSDAKASGAIISGAFTGVFDFSGADAAMKSAMDRINKVVKDGKDQIVNNAIDGQREYDKIWGQVARHGEGEGEGINSGKKPSNPFPADAKGGSGAGSGEDAAQLAMRNFQAESDAARNAAKDEQSSYDALLKFKLISNQAWLTDSLGSLDREQDAIQDAADRALSVAGLTSAQKIQIARREADQLATIDEKVKADNVKALDDIAKKYDSVFGAIGSAADAQIDPLLRGTQTWAQAFKNILASLIEDVAKFALNWTIQQGEAVAKNMLGFNAQVAAHVTGNATMAASDASSAAAGGLAWAGAAIKSIMASAAEAFAGVFGFLAPILGPAAAGPAAAAGATVSAAVGSVASADIGMWQVPSDMLTLVHHNELIMPATEAGALRAMLSNAGSGGAGAGQVSINPSTHFHVNALDGAGVESVLRNNQSGLMRQINQAVRHGAHLGLRRIATA